MAVNLGQVDASSTINIWFTTHAQTGASIAPLSAYEANDVRLYKNGSATERTSQAGWTMTSPFDAITGLHLLTIDLSDNTDAGFYAAGSRYAAVLSADTETVDGLTVVAVLAIFSIGPVSANTTQIAGAAVSATTAQLGVNVVNWNNTVVSTPATAGIPDINVKNAANVAWASGAITAASIATDAITAAKIAADAIGASELAADAVTEITSGIATLALTESYAADNTAMTLAQALYMIYSCVAQMDITGVNLTTRKLDGTTQALQFQLDSATVPTSRVRIA